MKNILVLTDFSAASNHAFEYCCIESCQIKPAKLILYHSYATITEDTDVESEELPSEDFHNASLKQLQHSIDEALKRYAGRLTFAAVASDKTLEEDINEFCAANDIDFIVMGSGGKNKKSVGSTAVKMVNTAHYPVMIVPVNAELKVVESVVFASDLQPMERSIEERIVRFFRAAHPRLYVLNVDRKERNFGPESSFELRELHSLLEEFNPEFIFTEDADTVEGVERITKEKSASLLITIHKERSWLYRLLHPSVTEELAVHHNTVLLSLYNGEK